MNSPAHSCPGVLPHIPLQDTCRESVQISPNMEHAGAGSCSRGPVLPHSSGTCDGTEKRLTAGFPRVSSVLTPTLWGVTFYLKRLMNDLSKQGDFLGGILLSLLKIAL